MLKEVSYEKVRRRLPENLMKFRSTAELAPSDTIIGQDRGVRALQFGLEMKGHGYNIYLSGRSGTGRKTAIIHFLEKFAKTRLTPPDWCYVNNFDDPRSPRALRLPAGRGREFKENMEWFIREAREALSQAFESDEYAKKAEETLKVIKEEQKQLTEKVKQLALEKGFLLQKTPIGISVTPIMDGKQIGEEELARLPDKERTKIQSTRKVLEGEIRDALRQFLVLKEKADETEERMNISVATYALEPLFKMMFELYDDLEEVKAFLEDVKGDILHDLPVILEDGQIKEPIPSIPYEEIKENPMERYRVNLLVDNSDLEGAPVVMVPHPTHRHIFGFTEKMSRFGTLKTDFTLIRGGAAHRANGGFLIIPVEDLFADPYVWDSLKRAIKNERLEVEDIPEPREFLTTKLLKPEPIPFDGKVILMGNRALYYKLYNLDSDFEDIFKVRAEFDTEMEWNEENFRKYSSFISTLCEKEGLKHLDPSGVAAIIEYSSRLAADQKKVSTQFGKVADIIREASYYASKKDIGLISKKHVDKALEERIYRSNLIQKKIEEMIARGVLLINTDGEEVGQINGLSVVTLGDYSFGRPNRVTASVGVGKGGIVDIEREAQMGGPIHTKGVMILEGFLNERYAQDKPLSLTARLVFEQSYSGVEGDSASSTELYALLSALSGKPIKQYLAVTGSVNQKGEVQAIGGVNEKVEGFYEVCKNFGLNGKQGVVIPASNVEELMLKEEIVDVIKEGKFHIYSVETVDEGIEVLTGVKAGGLQPDGSYEEGSINYLVQKRLMEMAERVREYSKLLAI